MGVMVVAVAAVAAVAAAVVLAEKWPSMPKLAEAAIVASTSMLY